MLAKKDNDEVKVKNLKAVIMLAGSVRPSPLRRSVKNSFLLLPIQKNYTIIDVWLQQIKNLAIDFSIEPLQVRVMQDQTSRMQNNFLKIDGLVQLTFEQDPIAYRGTGGLLRDLSDEYHDDDYLLVVNAAQVVLGSVTSLVKELMKIDTDIVIASTFDGTPIDLMLVRSGILKKIGKVGFVDIKEQALKNISKDHDVRVLRSNVLRALPIRTLDTYLLTIKEYYIYNDMNRDINHSFEDWQATFSIIDRNAKVHPSAVIHDSVVLAGAIVEENAVIVRSVVAPNGRVTNSQSIVDTVIGPSLE